jgi:ketol-acid reductoisomerase
MAQLNFGGIMENVVTREEFSLEKAREILKNETVAVIGYGVRPGQALNLKDNGIKVIVGQRKGTKSWDKALADGWVENETLFEVETACAKGTLLMNLLSDAGQIQAWETMKKHLTTENPCIFHMVLGLLFMRKRALCHLKM